MKELLIVGHGPSLWHKKLGKVLDSYPEVWRMEWTDWGKEEDYGIKCDYRINYDRDKLEVWEWVERMRETGLKLIKPTMGGLAALLAMKRGYKRLTLAGFDNVLDGTNEGFKERYIEVPCPPNVKCHDCHFERKILYECATKYDAEIIDFRRIQESIKAEA